MDPRAGLLRGKRADVLVLGALAVGAGVVLNPWTLGAWLSPDGRIESPLFRTVAFVAEVVLMAGGVGLVRWNPRIPWGKLALAAGSVVFVLLGLEGALRAGILDDETSRVQEFSAWLGWAPMAHVDLSFESGLYGSVTFTTERDGFRRWGDPDTDRIKILFLGDSFTLATTVSDGETYYDHIGRLRPDVEIFAYGGGGYGSLQEYMILDRYLDVVDPDVIVWQFCSNDLVNNDLGLESASLRNNNHMVRPYDQDGTVVRRFPHSNRLVRHSALARLVSLYMTPLVRPRLPPEWTSNARPGSIEDHFDREPELLRRSIDTTDRILARVRERADGRPVVAFTVDRPYRDGVYARLARKNDIRYVGGVPDTIAAARARGERVDFRPHDAHWSGRGHAVAAEVILRYLEDSGTLPAGGPPEARAEPGSTGSNQP